MKLSEFAGENGIFVDGDWVEKKDQDFNGSVRLIQLADVGAGHFLDKSNKHLTSSKAKELNCTYLHKGDILIARLGEPLCKACIFPYDGHYITAVDIAILRIGINEVNPNYLVYLINSPWFKEQIKPYESGTTRKRISRKNLNRIDINIPSIEIQNTIVKQIEESLSQLDSAVATLNKTKQQLEIYRQAVLKEAFGTFGQMATIKDVADTRLGKMLDKEKNIGRKRKYLRNINVRWFDFDLSDLIEMRIKDNEIEKYSITKGDLVMCEGGEPGRCAVWNKEQTIFYQKALHRIRFSEKSNPYFYMYYFWLINQSGFLSKYFTGTGIKHLTGQSLAKVPIPICSREQQNKIVSYIENKIKLTANIETTIDQSLQQAEALRQSILKQAFEDNS